MSKMGRAPSSSDSSSPFLTQAAASATYVARGTARIDLNQGPYNATVGQDITAALQAAITYIVANSPAGGEIYFTTPGTYLLTGAQQTGTALGYSYSGQVLFPASAFTTQPGIPIKITCAVRPTSGVTTTGKPQGVVLQSNATTGWVFDCIPAESAWGWKWTGVMPIFENVIVRLPDDPQCGGVNLETALRCKFDGFTVDTTGAWTFPTGTKEAIVLPHLFNNGDVTLRDVNIHGAAAGVRLSEHNVLDNVAVIGCATAFTCTNGGHSNWFGCVDVEECPTIFSVSAGNALTVVGHMDMENTATTGSFAFNTLVAGSGNLVAGALDLNISGAPSGGLGTVGGISQQLDVANIGQGIKTGWRNLHPRDDFTRLQGVTLSGTGAPGQCWPTLHPWRAATGGWSVAGNHLTGTTGTNVALVAAKDKGRSRSITATLTTGTAGYNVGLIAARPYDTGAGLYVKINGGNLILGIGAVFSGTTLATATGVVAASTGYTVTLEVYYTSGLPAFVNVLLNGTSVLTWQLTSAQQATLTASGTLPYLEDGVYTADTNSYFTSFTVADLQVAPASVSTATQVWVPAAEFQLSQGTPAVGNSGGVTGWGMATAVDSRVTASVPAAQIAGWNTFAVDYYWMQAATSTGNVRYRYEEQFYTSGDVATLAAIVATTQAALALAGKEQILTVVTGRTVTAGKELVIGATRTGTNGADTLNDTAFLRGVMLRRTA